MPAHDRGEIWLINFDPTKGDEIRKSRPGLVINSPGLRNLSLNIIVPITGWDAKYSGKPWFVKLEKNSLNGLNKDSAADAFQVKSLASNRFIHQIGEVKSSKLDDVVEAVALCIDY